MRQTSVSSYFFFGTAVRYLQDAQQGNTVDGSGGIVYNLEQAIKSLENIGLVTSLRGIDTLGIRKMLDELKSRPPKSFLTAEDAETLKEKASDLRKIIMAEAAGAFVYATTDKRIDVSKLLNKPEALFHPDCFTKLSDIARSDFKEACKCIAFELPTAGAFHLLRGTESVLRDYYAKTAKQNRIKQKEWGPLIKDLLSRKNQDATLLANLDNIRLSFRNPTQHPDKIYDIQEVQDLFGLCVDVVNRMAKKLS
jgi:hypothetical protein